MAKPYKGLELEKLYGDLETLIVPMVNKFDQKYAANQLGTSQNFISRWLKDNGYSKKSIYVKSEKTS